VTSVPNPEGAASRQWRKASESDHAPAEVRRSAPALRTVEDLPTGYEPLPSGVPCTCAVPYAGCHEHGPQPRERSVPCIHCFDATWSVDAVCDRCHVGWTVHSERRARRELRSARMWAAKAS
jgi:hypothetical protein